MADLDDGDEWDNSQEEATEQYLQYRQQQPVGDMMVVDGEEEEDILDLGEGMHGRTLEGGGDDVLLMRFCPHDSSMLYPQVSHSE